MALKRAEICGLTGFNSWTAVQVWLLDVVGPAHQELIHDYIQPRGRQGIKDSGGDESVKESLVQNHSVLLDTVATRVAELERGHAVLTPNKAKNWGTLRHFKHFIIEALTLDRLSARRSPKMDHISTRPWAADPVQLIANMYELTNAICHNHWKPATEDWDSDDSDVPFTDGNDVPGAH